MSIFIVCGLTHSEIGLESIASVADALSTRALIGCVDGVDRSVVNLIFAEEQKAAKL